ncbi:hypothetical protein [Streptomyces sp. NPDC058548]|uniref:hypothetical protein n=1 Tax=Streptomyces sp. NPDC058548 TaxID=3346545 RepID=UPI00365B168D
MHFATPEEAQGFLRLCLDGGPGRVKRTITQLALIMPDWLAEQFTEHAPELAVLRDEVNAAEAAATAARERYTEGLRAWIADELGTEGEEASP